MKLNLQKKSLALVAILMVAVLSLVGCSGSSSDSTPEKKESEVKASQTVKDLESGMSAQDDAKIEETLSDEVEITTASGTNTYTKSEFITHYKNNEQLKQLFQIKEDNVEQNGDTVIIRGEAGMNLGAIPDVSSMQRNSQFDLMSSLVQSQAVKQKVAQALVGSNGDLQAASTESYNGDYCSFQYSSTWDVISLEEIIKEELDSETDNQDLDKLLQDLNMDLITMAKKDNDEPVAGVIMHVEDQETNLTEDGSLDNITNEQLTQAEKELVTAFDEAPNCANGTVDIIKTAVDNVPAVDITAAYDFTYQPLVVELKLKEQDGEMVIKAITIRRGADKTIRIKGNATFAMDQDRLIFMYYIGEKNAYDRSSGEIDNMRTSYDVLSNN